MIFIDRDLTTRSFGYKIISNEGGTQRILEENYGWESPGDVMQYVEELKKAMNEGLKTIFK
jgi:hypothetical protein